jgi:cytochrome c
MEDAMRNLAVFGCLLFAASGAVQAAPDAARGRQVFGQACVACHSLEPNKNMTGPSLSGIMGRKAGSLASFLRYSPALKSSGITWNDKTLNAWLKDPKALISGNRMMFPGLPDEQTRGDIVAFLKEAAQPGQAAPTMQGMMGMGAGVPNLKSVPASEQVKDIIYCGDTYTVTTADGQTVQFWERNLRFKTDSSAEGPPKGLPAIVGAGMVGDRSSVIFAAPEEIGQFVKRRC